MTLGDLLVFSILCLLILDLPSTSGRLLLDHSLARGKTRAAALVPAILLGSLLCFAAGFGIHVWLAESLRTMLDALSWCALAYLAVYVLRGLQMRQRFRLADNDNLGEKTVWPALSRGFVGQLRPGLAVAIAALLFQTADSSADIAERALHAGLAFALAAIAAPVIQIVFARQRAMRLQRTSRGKPGLDKSRTRFIARRAVSAGYRRIAA
ncbi:hypothetical protein [Rhizobium sp. CSW-27]|uniref:hypothetical protein n=1 Tax=Rhizobium sp. CSW-27 TaxID=2839985 RepID=UPI001C02163B|nr:hypothetical protein [Rhizobium sp. CSW-27]MBT9371044.1 hypothetical protein [Rhizobium sp. CSW-27]